MKDKIYQRVADTIRDDYRDTPPGTKLPSGPELEAKYDCSRASATRARAALLREGWLVAEPGRGTFVINPEGDTGVRQIRSEEIYAEVRALVEDQRHGKELLPLAWLAAKFGCSEATMRRVLVRLADKGFLRRDGRRWKVWNP